MDCKKGHEMIDGCECIECITCEVANCAHNDERAHRCTAEQIKVGPRHATSTAETLCDTFRAK